MAKLYEGLCVGGPLDGVNGQSRFPRGFVYADAIDGRVWVYDFRDGPDASSAKLGNRPRFIAREEDQLDVGKLTKAAQGSTYDVRAYDPGVVV